MAAAAKLKTSSAQAQATCLLLINISTRSGFVCLENCGQRKRHIILVDSPKKLISRVHIDNSSDIFSSHREDSPDTQLTNYSRKRLKELPPSFADGPAGGPRPGEQEWQQGVGQPRSQGDHESQVGFLRSGKIF